MHPLPFICGRNLAMPRPVGTGKKLRILRGLVLTVGGAAAKDLLIVTVKGGIAAETVQATDFCGIGVVLQRLLCQKQLLLYDILLRGHMHML